MAFTNLINKKRSSQIICRQNFIRCSDYQLRMITWHLFLNSLSRSLPPQLIALCLRKLCGLQDTSIALDTRSEQAETLTAAMRHRATTGFPLPPAYIGRKASGNKQTLAHILSQPKVYQDLFLWKTWLSLFTNRVLDSETVLSRLENRYVLNNLNNSITDSNWSFFVLLAKDTLGSLDRWVIFPLISGSPAHHRLPGTLVMVYLLPAERKLGVEKPTLRHNLILLQISVICKTSLGTRNEDCEFSAILCHNWALEDNQTHESHFGSWKVMTGTAPTQTAALC